MPAGLNAGASTAESMISEWPTSPFHTTLDPDGAWVRAVLDPMLSGDASGVIEDQPQSCAQASIVNVKPQRS